MKKKTVLYILLDLIFLVVFNAVFFLVGGTEHTASVWIAYGFIHFSYIMVLATPLLVRKSSSAAVFGYALDTINSTYFFVEFIVGLVFIFLKSESYKASLIINIILTSIYAAVLISNMIANENTTDSVERRENEVAYIKNAASRVKMLMGKVSDKKADKEIEKAYDLLHSSPSRSTASVKVLEEHIRNTVSELENAVSANNTAAIIAVAGNLVSLIEERNRRLRISQ